MRFMLLMCFCSSLLRAQQSPATNTATHATPRSTIRFEDAASSAGVHFHLHNAVSAQRYSIETMAGGVAVFDYNNDGRPDLFFTNGAAIPSLEKDGPQYWNRLYRNNGDGTFTDVTEQAHVQGIGYSMGVAAGDFDNDGFVDLYITGVNQNQLLHNNGDGTFTDITAKAGVAGLLANGKKGWSVAAGWFDYNNDGLLDLLVVNYLDYSVKTAALCSANKLPTYCSPNDFDGLPNILYRNNGDGTFTDVSHASHIDQFVGKGMGLAFSDYDQDGHTDIFISNDTFPNFLLHNNDDGTFSEVAMDAGVAFKQDGKAVASMGTDFRDLDNDGRPDIFHTAMFGDSFPLYKNQGDGTFQEVTETAGLGSATAALTGWGAGIYDFDNDGLKDLFTANAAILDNAPEVEHHPYELPDSIFQNIGNLRFRDVSSMAGAAILRPLAHRGAAFGDLNGDGLVDAVTTVLNGSPQLLINHTNDGRPPQQRPHWIEIVLRGTKDNRDGLGARVAITTAEGTQYNEATTAVGYNSSSDKAVHFGLGGATSIDTIRIHWPTGIEQTLQHVRADQRLTIVEAADPTAAH
jgi:hypothetical protein